MFCITGYFRCNCIPNSFKGNYSRVKHQANQGPDMFREEDVLLLIVPNVIILIVGIIANTLALIVICRTYRTTGHSLRLSVPSLLVKALVTVDLCSVILLLVESGTVSVLFPGTALKCNMDYTIRLSVAYASGFINAVMCLERCLAFRAPFFYHDHATVFKAKVIVVIVIGLSVSLSVLPLLGVGDYAADTMTTPANATVVVCTPPGELGSRSDLGNKIFMGIYITVGACMLSTIYICNTLVMLTLRDLGRKTAGLEQLARYIHAGSLTSSRPPHSTTDLETQVTVVNPNEGGTNQNLDDSSFVYTKDKDILPKVDPEKSKARIGREIRLAYTVCVISVVFTISWLPFYVQRLLKAFDVNQPNWYLLLVVVLLVSNHVVDPFVFVFMKQQSRDALKDLCMRCVCCRKCCAPPALSEPSNLSGNGRRIRGASRQDSGVVVVTDPIPNPAQILAQSPAHNPHQDHAHDTSDTSNPSPS
ncbi:uncharacterized protein LOC591775 isoform X2 [Strongylocentrotus purpuratus]|uniref:G-protein coupled receptors family 1 profile domain-containing protein n=1 Tax=Strongylocentrotus purpuratus TaxID=7668 RepID=A0A7M7LT26_STRPU|nr:uncharacterized protein LOC591775 isoform X2 [Strongylocentrotus purpuratus]